MADYKEEDDILIETEPEDFDHIEEHGAHRLCRSESTLQLEGPRHHITTPNFLFKVFGQE